RLQQVATAFIFNSRMNVPQVLDYMRADFGIPCEWRANSQVLLRLYNWLRDRYRAGETAVPIVDKAQTRTDEVLKESRLLTNLESIRERVIRMVMVGRGKPEQSQTPPQRRHLRQRVRWGAKTPALAADETRAYIQQRLGIAGSNGQQIFDPDAVG